MITKRMQGMEEKEGLDGVYTVYYKVRTRGGKDYWQCKRYKSKECRATAITQEGRELIVVKGVNEMVRWPIFIR